MARNTSSGGKEAIVFILDTSPSMLEPYPSLPTSSQSDHDDTSSNGGEKGVLTRLSFAKKAIEHMICDLMIQSKTNEVGVILLRRKETRHHLCLQEQVMDDTAVFPNLVELSRVCRPNVDLLRQIRDVDCNDMDGMNRGGCFCDGLILAANAMYNRTNNKKFKRRIVLLTDAAHEVEIDSDQIERVVNGLRDLQCTITVFGFDFHQSASFCVPASDDDNNNNDNNDNHKEDDDEHGHGNESIDELERKSLIKSENEKFLISLTKWTGGRVIAASTIEHILEPISERRIPRSSRTKLTFHVAPNLVTTAYASLLTTKSNLPNLKREAIQIETNPNTKNAEPIRNGLGEIMTEPITSATTHWDADDPQLEVEMHQRTQAFKYGSDLIPIGQFDLNGLKTFSSPSLTILGYVDKHYVKPSILMGPARAISGGDSRSSCVLISALATALYRLNQVAICTFVGRKDADSLMGILSPLLLDENEEVVVGDDSRTSGDSDRQKNPCTNEGKLRRIRHLVYVQMPFSDDFQKLSMLPLDDVISSNQDRGTAGATNTTSKDAAITACDNLIDSLMLPNEVFKSENLANPAIRAFHKTLMNRAISPSADCNSSMNDQYAFNDLFHFASKSNSNKTYGKDNPIMTPKYIRDKSKRPLDVFRETFPLKLNEEENGTAGTEQRRGGRQSIKKFWSDA